MKSVEVDGGKNVFDPWLPDLESCKNFDLLACKGCVQFELFCHGDKVFLENLKRDRTGSMQTVVSNYVESRALLHRL